MIVSFLHNFYKCNFILTCDKLTGDIKNVDYK